MTELVLDSSAAVWAVGSRSSTASALRRRLPETSCHVPHLFDAEVGNVLRREVLIGELTPDAARAALRVAHELVDERYPHGPLADAAWELRNNVTYYDALYVALAARLGVPLLTAGGRLSRASGLSCDIEVVN